ncbi:MAG TPA: 3-hydroxybutyrate oligomer hydrolase family protein [Kofleriaceae bacterium]|nr:3-hydroxybutyrate oligomer hydrolase family protein [Kofleriaceae bacterium]
MTAIPGLAHAGCPEVLAALAHGPHRIVDATCVDSADLTTANAATTPADNALAGLPVGAFTPSTDRNVISPSAGHRTPITRAVAGVQVSGRFADDPTGEARFLLRFPVPSQWNGRLVVAGASGTRSEHNGDFAWSDYVIQKGYAYVSQNKGVLNLQITSLASPTQPASDPLSCRLNPSSQVWVHFFDNDPAKPFTQWTDYMIEAAKIGQRAAERNYQRAPLHTYAVGTSNGGYQVRRAIEKAPELFDGGVDWEGTFVDPDGPNLLIDLPPAIANFAAYAASGFDPNSLAAKNILAAGYPPDIVSGTASLWGLYAAQFWEVTQCQWQKRFDPTWQTYAGGVGDTDGTGGYDYAGRAAQDPQIASALGAIATTGKIKRPLITVAGTMDGLLPIQRGARAYEAAVLRHHRNAESVHDARKAPYRLYEVQNGNHIETFKDTFPQLELIQPHAQRAFDLLVDHVEHSAHLPPSQCIPRGGAIADGPSQPGHCAQLFAP